MDFLHRIPDRSHRRGLQSTDADMIFYQSNSDWDAIIVPEFYIFDQLDVYGFVGPR